MGVSSKAIRVMTYFKGSNFPKNAGHDFLNGPFITTVVSSRLLPKLSGKLSQDHRSEHCTIRVRRRAQRLQCSNVAFQLVMENLYASQVINGLRKAH